MSECKHTSVAAYFIEATGESAQLWACRDCKRKFYPWEAVEKMIEKEVERLSTEVDALEERRDYWRDTEAKTMAIAQSLNAQVERLSTEVSRLLDVLEQSTPAITEPTIKQAAMNALEFHGRTSGKQDDLVDGSPPLTPEELAILEEPK